MFCTMGVGLRDLRVWQEAVGLGADVIRSLRHTNRREIKAITEHTMVTAMLMAEHVAEDLNLDRVGGSSRVEQVSLSSAVQECRGCLTFAVLHLFADECRATTASRNEEKRCGCCP